MNQTMVTALNVRPLKPGIAVIGVGGGGGNAVNNMIVHELEGVEFIVANTDAQALSMSKAPRLVQLGLTVTEGLGAGSLTEIGQAAAEETIDEIMDHLAGTHMCFVTAGMGGDTGTDAAPVIARAARKAGILTVVLFQIVAVAALVYGVLTAAAVLPRRMFRARGIRAEPIVSKSTAPIV